MDIIQISPCGQEKIKYTIDHTNNDLDVVLKYEPSIYDALEEDDYYVTNGYDIEIILPKKKFGVPFESFRIKPEMIKNLKEY